MIQGFPPIEAVDAEILILGSIPSVKSLEESQYYGHPRNAFWDIMGELLGFERNLDYDKRKECLIKNKIAIWDVLKGCEREGSLDSAIKNDSMEINDFITFLKTHPKIRKIFFNGKKAEIEFTKRVLPDLENHLDGKEYTNLPSTSPAMASLTKSAKLAEWKKVLNHPPTSPSGNYGGQANLELKNGK